MEALITGYRGYNVAFIGYNVTCWAIHHNRVLTVYSVVRSLHVRVPTVRHHVTLLTLLRMLRKPIVQGFLKPISYLQNTSVYT